MRPRLIHGAARKNKCLNPLYGTWSGIKSRCHNPNDESYKSYGARGIEMCERWRNSFEAFLADIKELGPKPSPAHSLDRWPDNNKGYEPTNVRWATKKEQADNTRRNVLITAFGKTQNATQWAADLDIPAPRILHRHAQGCSPEQCLSSMSPRQYHIRAMIAQAIQEKALATKGATA